VGEETKRTQGRKACLLHPRDMNSFRTFALAAGIGAIAGLRTFTPLAVVSHAARRNLLPLRRSRLGVLRSSTTANTLAAFAVGELVADKLPSTPSRLDAGPLVARVLSGAACAAAISTGARQCGRTVAAGAAVGGLAAIGGALIGYHVRRAITSNLNVPDPAIALLEDMVAVGGAVAILSRRASLTSFVTRGLL
jgi:uncharacterized membrane protein